MLRRKRHLNIAVYLLVVLGLFGIGQLVRKSRSSYNHKIKNEIQQYDIIEPKSNKTESEMKKFLRRQMETKKNIKSYCKNFTNILPVIEDEFYSLIVDKRSQMTYCPINNVASQSWIKILLEIRKLYFAQIPVKILKEMLFQKISPNLGPSLTKLTYKIIVVRHPFERIVSVYRSRFENAAFYYYYHKYGEKMVKKFRKTNQKLSMHEMAKLLREVDKYLTTRYMKFRDKTNYINKDNPYAKPIGPTFEEFLKYVLSSAEKDVDYWRPYYIHCSMCYMKYDFILRFENISSDTKLLLENLRLSDKASLSWENPTASGPTTEDIGCQYFHQINKDLVLKLVDKYEHDFKIFNYSYEKYLKCSKEYN